VVVSCAHNDAPRQGFVTSGCYGEMWLVKEKHMIAISMLFRVEISDEQIYEWSLKTCITKYKQQRAFHDLQKLDISLAAVTTIEAERGGALVT